MLIDSLIFQPERAVPDPPRGVSERWVRTKDGVDLHAWCAEGRGDRPTLIWSHGNGGNIAGRADVLLALAARGLNVVAYDYRGYGKSGGQPSEAGVYRDAQAVYGDVRRRGVPAARLICFGESLGGCVSIHLASHRPCAGVAVVSTFTRMHDVARHHYGVLGVLVGSAFDTLARLRKLSVPIFIAHGDQDEIVPFELGERLFAAAREPKQFYRARGAHHNDVFAAPGVLDAVAKFAHALTEG